MKGRISPAILCFLYPTRRPVSPPQIYSCWLSLITGPTTAVRICSSFIRSRAPAFGVYKAKLGRDGQIYSQLRMRLGAETGRVLGKTFA